MSPRVQAPAGTEKDVYLYVAVNDGLNVFTYPKIKLVRSIKADESFPRVCSDPKTGHVFLSETYGLNEYDRGAAKLIQTFPAPSGYGPLLGCSIDPLSATSQSSRTKRKAPC